MYLIPARDNTKMFEVTEEFYHDYRQMNWREEKREQKYQRWFIPFSSLKGGLNPPADDPTAAASPLPRLCLVRQEQCRAVLPVQELCQIQKGLYCAVN